MYESHGLLTTSDGSMMILAGSTVGGGTTINWSCCLPLPEYVREEWADSFGLDSFSKGGEYDKALNYVLIKVGALDRSKIVHNPMNKKLQRGCDLLGFRWEETGQNLRNTGDPTAGYVCFGDRYGNKNAGISVFLRDAAKKGARILDNCRVTRIVQGNWKVGVPTATGAECMRGDQKIKISAKKAVVVAGGALQTPCLLLRSGLRNPHIGRHLRLHPVTAVMGFMKESENIDCFLGAPMTSVCNEFERGPLDNGYGAKIECPSAHPGLLAAGITWSSPNQFKGRMKGFRHGLPLIVLQRDSGEGRVRLARDGVTPVIDYSLSTSDKQSMKHAMTGGLKILMTGGAQAVQTGHVRDTGFNLKGRWWSGLSSLFDDEKVKNYLSFVSRQDMKRHEIGLFSAHQMGSCRMGTSPSSGAVDLNGETWECNNLFVMDSSTFPTATGVNPMVTVLVMAKMLSTRLALRLRYEEGRQTGMAEAVRAEEFVARRKEMRSIGRGPRTLPVRYLPHLILWIVVVILFVPFDVLVPSWQSKPVVPPPPTSLVERFFSPASPVPPPTSPVQKRAPPSLQKKKAPSIVPAPSSSKTKPPEVPSRPPTYETISEKFPEFMHHMPSPSILPYSVIWTALLFPILFGRG